MFRWLSRYVKKITIMGVGIELREIPEEEALPLLEASTKTPSEPSKTRSRESAPLVQREDYIRVSGTSASEQRTPRELDLMLDGEEIQLHIHQPGGTQKRMWVNRKTLQEALDRWPGPGPNAAPITVPGRTTRKEEQVVFIVDNDEEAEVQAGWWIWVPPKDLKAALEALGLRIPW